MKMFKGYNVRCRVCGKGKPQKEYACNYIRICRGCQKDNKLNIREMRSR